MLTMSYKTVTYCINEASQAFINTAKITETGKKGQFLTNIVTGILVKIQQTSQQSHRIVGIFA